MIVVILIKNGSINMFRKWVSIESKARSYDKQIPYCKHISRGNKSVAKVIFNTMRFTEQHLKIVG